MNIKQKPKIDIVNNKYKVPNMKITLMLLSAQETSEKNITC